MRILNQLPLKLLGQFVFAGLMITCLTAVGESDPSSPHRTGYLIVAILACSVILVLWREAKRRYRQAVARLGVFLIHSAQSEQRGLSWQEADVLMLALQDQIVDFGELDGPMLRAYRVLESSSEANGGVSPSATEEVGRLLWRIWPHPPHSLSSRRPRP